jgi:hypothetical protein
VSAGTRRIGLAVSGLMLGMLAFAAPASALTETFNFTGAAQTWNVPPGVGEATFDLLGAQGGGSPRRPVAPGGLGGRATGTIAVTPDSPIQVNVGGQGGQGDTDTGGFNGGGWGNSGGFGGGGASDIRIGGTALTDRALVAGGGGGTSMVSCTESIFTPGGDGGGPSGADGASSGCTGGAGGGGGTQTAGGSAGTAQAGQFGLGGTGAPSPAYGGGGGGGWYGGGGGDNGAGGGGGSGYGPPGATLQTGVKGGDGMVSVTYTPTITTLLGFVYELSLPSGFKASLQTTLNAAGHDWLAGNIAGACDQLGAFISQVNGQSGKKIPAADADQLTSAAAEVRTSLNCGAALTCAGQKATIVGTGRPDRLKGTLSDDVVVTKGGGDTVVGLRGDDLVCGGAGADLIRGQGGDDTLRGGSGKDELRGGAGANRCRGGSGEDLGCKP